MQRKTLWLNLFGKSFLSQIFALRLLHQRFIHRLDTISVFLDFIAAFESIIRPLLWQIMLEDSVPTKIVNLVRAYFENNLSNVRKYGELTELF
jgi:hypothetical protein